MPFISGVGNIPEDGSQSSEQHASFLRRIFFSWLNPMLKKGLKKPLEFEDVLTLPEGSSASDIHHIMQQAWNREVQSGRKSLFRALLVVVRMSLWVSGLLQIPIIACQLLTPLLLRWLLDFVEECQNPTGAEPSLWTGIVFTVFFFLVPTVQGIMQAHHVAANGRAEMSAVAALRAAIFQKSLQISESGKEGTTAGRIVNLLSIECEQVGRLYYNIHNTWSTPIVVAFCMYLLFDVLSFAGFAGILCILLMMPIQSVLLKRFNHWNELLSESRSQRTSVMSEILQGIRAIKFNAWMRPFQKRVEEARAPEFRLLKKTTMLVAAIIALFDFSPVVISVATFVWYSLTTDVLVASTIFPALTLIQTLQVPMVELPETITELLQAQVALKRLRRFMASTEVDGLAPIQQDPPPGVKSLPGSVHVHRMSCSFVPEAVVDGSQVASEQLCEEEEERKQSVALSRKGHSALLDDGRALDNDGEDGIHLLAPEEDSAEGIDVEDGPAAAADPTLCLEDISLQASPGDFVAIVGAVGSGKTTLLKALFGDVHRIPCPDSALYICGRVSYCPQDPWILNASFRENIVQNEPFDPAKYERILGLCELLRDRELLPGRDDCELGENGVNISMGQKQRISLARAVYRDADVYLLDSPLSAVDALVGRHIFSECILGHLHRKTRIMVTHNASHLPHCSHILCMHGGRVVEEGTFEEIGSGGKPVFDQLLKSHSIVSEEGTLGGGSEEREEEVNIRPTASVEVTLEEECGLGHRLSSTEGTLQSHAVSEAGCSALDFQKLASLENVACRTEGGLLVQENRERGKVSAKTLWDYLKGYGCFYLPMAIVMALGVELTRVFNSLWMSSWIDDGISQHKGQGDLPPFDASAFLLVYGLLGLTSCVCSTLRSFSVFLGGQQTAQNMHTTLLKRVLFAPVQFFDTNPAGRILNRFSRDLSKIETTLPEGMLWLTYCFSELFGIIIIIAVRLPWALVALLPTAFFFVVVQRPYRASYREIRRLSSMSNSPIFDMLSSMLRGLPALRAHSLKEESMQQSLLRISLNQRCTYVSTFLSQWLVSHMALMVCIIRLTVGVFAILFRHSLPASTVGLVSIYVLWASDLFRWLITNLTEAESSLTSAERILAYSNLPGEGEDVPHHKERTHQEHAVDAQPGALVEFLNCDMRYRKDLDLSLRNVSLTLRPGEKVGVIGRTGAGKSSLTMALLRMVEISNGTILFDGRDAQKMPLEELRKEITIIPQDPVLFSGDIRKNLDPLYEYQDEELWRVLQESGLADFVESQEDGLALSVSENGSNLSVGQRQLLCLGRALLRHTRLLVLDEATASLDPESDQRIQRMLKENFRHCTILCIAHRLDTIAHFDKIVVMERGSVAEEGSPAALAADPRSLYAQLLAASEVVE